MVKQYLVKMVIQLASSVGKSVFQAYKNTIKSSGAHKHAGGSSNKDDKFGEFFKKTMGGLNITHKQMEADEAHKILQIDPKEINPNSILDAYYRMYSKNSLKNGGSFYIQSKIFTAKELLIQDFPGAEEEYRKENGLDEDQNSKKDKKEEATDKATDAKNKEQKENNNNKTENNSEQNKKESEKK